VPVKFNVKYPLPLDAGSPCGSSLPAIEENVTFPVGSVTAFTHAVHCAIAVPEVAKKRAKAATASPVDLGVIFA